MKEIVINADFGGFGLSPQAIEMYVKRKYNKQVYFYTQRQGDWHGPYYLMSGDKVSFTFTIMYTKYMGEKYFPDEKDGADSFYDRTIPRDDEILVEVVRELGKYANGPCARLKVVKIPNDTIWEIEEHDGKEKIVEKHRSWG